MKLLFNGKAFPGLMPLTFPKTLRIMKLTAVLILSVALHVTARTYSQTVTITGKRMSVDEVFKQIETQTGYSILWNDRLFDKNYAIDLDVKEVSIQTVMTACLKGLPLSYKISGKLITIEKYKEPDNLAEVPLDIKGTVKSEQGEPLAGATVQIRSLNRMTTTDGNGIFIFENVPKGKYEVEISFLGFSTVKQMTTVGHQDAVLNVVMSLATKSLDDFVLKGYYSVAKRYNTGNVSTINADAISKQAVVNPMVALEGLMPGLFIQQTSGMAGAPVAVAIRGYNSLSTNTYPLYVIDGVPYGGAPVDQQNALGASLTGPNGGSDPLNLINPHDIESISVLKDADATSIYGARGANGVILITTKHGKAGKAKLDINASTGIGRVSRMIPMMNIGQYLAIRKSAFAADSITPNNSNAPDLTLWSQTQNTNYEKQLIGGTNNMNDIDASVSGGDQLTTFLLGGSFHTETTVQPGATRYLRGALNMTVNHNSADGKLQVNMSTIYATDNNNIAGTDFTSATIGLPPNFPVYSNGVLNFAGNISNPYATLNQRFVANSNNLILNADLAYTFIPGLQFKVDGGINRAELTNKNIIPSDAYNPAYGIPGTGYYDNNTTTTYKVEPQLNFNTMISKGKLSALIGGTYQSTEYKEPYLIIGTNFPSEALMNNYASAGSILEQFSTSSEYKYVSAYGRLGYVWDDKYIINGTFRRDGSSKFGPAHRFGNFGSVGGAWIFSDESFLKNANWLSLGKLRGSYGIVGNDQTLSNYGYVSTYNGALPPYGSNTTLVPTGVANADYRWEKTTKIEVAAELGFLKNRLNVTGSVYRNRSNDLLASYPLSPQTGFTSYVANLHALVQNKGLEIEISAKAVDGKTFSWNTSFNISVNRNKLLSFPGLLQSSYAGQYIVGQPLNTVGLYHFTGFQNGVATVEDVEKNGNISPGLAANGLGDFINAGTTDPKFFGGFNNTIRYKQFQLDLLFNFVKQKKYNINSFPGQLANYAYVVTGFTPSTIASSASYNSYENYYINSDATFTDASFVRLKNLSLSYNFPDRWKKALHMANGRIYLKGQNLLTITKYQGFDPESASSTFLGASMPSLKTLTAGIQLTF